MSLKKKRNTNTNKILYAKMSRYEIKKETSNSNTTTNKSSYNEYLTRFEEASIIGHRAQELAFGKSTRSTSDPDFLKFAKDDIEIATRELKEGKINMTVRRYFPNGSYIDYPVSSLKVRPI